MTTLDSRVWMPRAETCNQGAFRAGVDRALATAFPPVNGSELPGRIMAALVRLERALQSHDAQARGGSAGPPVSA